MRTISKRKGWLAMMLVTIMLAVTACGGNNNTNTNAASSSPVASSAESASASPSPSAADSDKKITLKLAMWDTNNAFITYLTEKVKEYSTVKPNVTVEVESFKSDGDYLQAMKVRNSANALPDIFELKPNFLNDFKDELEPLDDQSFISTNIYAKKFAIDGKVLAVPTVSFPELVYYHPSVFKELNLTVPTTWPQFLDVLKKIEDNSKYIPYAMGGKDGWPNYPFNEFMPLLVSGSETYLSDIAKEDAPFAEGTPFYKSFSLIDQLYSAEVMGPDPLGVSWDQATGLFESKKAAIVAAGLWYLAAYQSKVGNTDDLAAFPLPYREDESQPLKVMTFTDHFYGINKSSANVAAAKEFMTWFYSPEVYQTYIDTAQIGSAFEGISANVPFLTDFYANNKVEAFTYLPGDATYTSRSNAIQLDWKKLGQEMMAGKKLADIAKETNDKWAKAK